ncbi:MAG: FtsX-like permease family protein [Marinilabiliales bacterium]|nr:FtsX-like permease family protein [Marinilabiliales bacterium]
MGSEFLVQNRYEQQEMFYKVMKAERLAIYVILTFILIIASFNIIGSLTMLIIEKERDINILKSLGADNSLIKRIFIYEGWMISIIGTALGLILGLILYCAAQQHFGIVKLAGESLLIDAYPVKMQLIDFCHCGGNRHCHWLWRRMVPGTLPLTEISQQEQSGKEMSLKTIIYLSSAVMLYHVILRQSGKQQTLRQDARSR